MKNTVEGKQSSVYLMMLPKHVHIYRKLQFEIVHFKAYFHTFSIFRTGCLSTFKNPIRFHPHKIQSTWDKI